MRMRWLVVMVVVLLAPNGSTAPPRPLPFYAPLKFPAGTSMALSSLKQGEHQCWVFKTDTTYDATLMLSSSNTSECVGMRGEITLYPASAIDPTLWTATSHDGIDKGRCSKIERRIAAGTWKVCVASISDDPLPSFALHKTLSMPGPVWPNDRCDSATLLEGTVGTVPNATLKGMANDHSPLPRGVCKLVSFSRGPERVWAVDLKDGQRLDVTLTSQDGTGILYLLSDCQHWWNSCVAASFRRSTSTELSYQHRGPTKRYFVVVDTRYDESITFSFTWSLS